VNSIGAALLILAWLLKMVLFPQEGRAELSAKEIMALAQQQLTVPSELVLGEMRVYRGERLNHFYSFMLGKLWDEKTQAEYVRIDFKSATKSSPYTDCRYLLKRTSQTLPTQWLYLPALRRVRIVPYQPDDPLLHSDYLFYDLTAMQNFGDYRYRFVDPNERAPVIEGEPQNPLVPYQRTVFHLERREGTYIVAGIRHLARGQEKQVRFSGFTEIASGHYRPQKITVVAEGGRTEFVFSCWTLDTPKSQLFTPVHLGTQTLTFPNGGGS
jgi:hypothetical protein